MNCVRQRAQLQSLLERKRVLLQSAACCQKQLRGQGTRTLCCTMMHTPHIVEHTANESVFAFDDIISSAVLSLKM